MNNLVNLNGATLSESTILCVIDFSEASKEALKLAAQLAKTYESNLTVLYPYRLTQLNHNGEDLAQLKKSIDSDANQNFSRMTADLSLESDISFEFRPEVGFINDRIYAFAKKKKIGLVVMSKRVIQLNRDAFNELLTQTQVPLLILPQKEKNGS